MRITEQNKRHVVSSASNAKPKATGKGKKNAKGIPSKIEKWDFKPRLQNESIVIHSIFSDRRYDLTFCEQIVEEQRERITRLVQNHGFHEAGKRIKTVRNYCISLIEGRNPENPGWLATSKSYKVPSPSVIGKNTGAMILDSLREEDPLYKGKYYQAIQTIFAISRMVEGGSEADLESITEPAKIIDKSFLEDFSQFIEGLSFLQRFDSSKCKALHEYRNNVTKASPNKTKKYQSADQEAFALLRNTLSRPFKALCLGLGYGFYVDFVEKRSQCFINKTLESFPEGTQPLEMESQLDKLAEDTVLRLLQKVPDKDFKTRIVAIPEIHSQTILEPFRDHVQTVLKNNFSDTEFRMDQQAGVNSMQEFQAKCIEKLNAHNGEQLDVKHLVSYDMTAWTDRFHHDLQKIVVRRIFSPTVAESWSQLVVHCEWSFQGHKLKYSQGQGMGTNGSFDIATLTMQLILMYLVSKNPQLQVCQDGRGAYGEVGDDLWIYDPEGPFKKLMDDINCPINLSKSKVFGELGSVMEFCAQTTINGVNVSKISPNVISRSKDFRNIPSLIAMCAARNIELDASLFGSLNNTVKEDPSKTYLDMFQPWLVSHLLIGEFEKTPLFGVLTMEYLERNNWVTPDSILHAIMDDPTKKKNILVSYFIISFLDNFKVALDKLYEVLNSVDDDIFIPIRKLFESKDKIELFDINSAEYQLVCKHFKTEDLTMEQIILFERLKNQRKLIMNLAGTVRVANSPAELSAINKAYYHAAQSSCYDGGNLYHDKRALYNAEFRMVRVMDHMDYDSWKVLTLDTSVNTRDLSNYLESLGCGDYWKDLVLDIQLSD